MKIVRKGDPFGFSSREDQWTPTEDQTILEVKKVSSKPWTDLASLLNRSPSACYARYDELVNKPPSDHRGTVRKRTFSADKPGKKSKVANPSVLLVKRTFSADKPAADWKVGSTGKCCKNCGCEAVENAIKLGSTTYLFQSGDSCGSCDEDDDEICIGDDSWLHPKELQFPPYAVIIPVNVNEPANGQDDLPFNNDNADEMHEDIFREIYNNKTTEGTSNSTHVDSLISDVPSSNATINQTSERSADQTTRSPDVAQVTEEQKALMEPKRLKALERAAARFRLLNAS